MEKIIIRPARFEEANFLTDLTLRSKSYWGYSQEFLDKCRPHLIITDSYIQDWPFGILEVKGKICGYFSLKTIDGEHRLDNLWIEPDEVRKGYGSLLIEKAMEKAKELGWNSIRMAVDKYGVGFYEKHGGKIIGKVQSRLGNEIFLNHMEIMI